MNELTEGTTRRAVIAGAGVAGAGLLLAGCSPGADGGDGPGSGEVLATANEVPVGGGTIAGKVVIIQLKAGEFKGFSAICPHQGCNMVEIDPAKGVIRCGCHDSRFSISDGSVVNGPATDPLRPVSLKITDNEITLG